MKLYTVTYEHSLPRLALKGMPYGTLLYAELYEAVEEAFTMAEDDDSKPVILVMDGDAVEDITGVDGDWGEAMIEMAGSDVMYKAEEEGRQATEEEIEAAQDAFRERLENLQNLQDAIDIAGNVMSLDTIPAKLISVLGEVDVPKGWEEAAQEGEGEDWKPPVPEFKGKPRPLTSFKRPYVTRLLRSIFLPTPKLYGAGMAGARMGLRKQAEEPYVAPELIGDIELVWSAGKTFRRGVRGAFGKDQGAAIADVVAMRIGQEPGKLLGHGKKGAVYKLRGGVVLKITMDAREVEAAQTVLGIRHPNLSEVHDVFVVRDNGKGIGVIVRDAVDSRLDKKAKEQGIVLDAIMTDAVEKVENRERNDEDPRTAVGIEMADASTMVMLAGCELDSSILWDTGAALKELHYLGIYGLDFGSENFGIVRKPTPRAVLFDYGMAFVLPIEVPVITPWHSACPL